MDDDTRIIIEVLAARVSHLEGRADRLLEMVIVMSDYEETLRTEVRRKHLYRAINQVVTALERAND